MYEIFKIKVLQDVKNTPVFLLDIERECESLLVSVILGKSQVQKMDVGGWAQLWGRNMLLLYKIRKTWILLENKSWE